MGAKAASDGAPLHHALGISTMQDNTVIVVVILSIVALLVLGIVLRAFLSAENSPSWLAFLARRKAEGRPTRWKEWKDED